MRNARQRAGLGKPQRPMEGGKGAGVRGGCKAGVGPQAEES